MNEHVTRNLPPQVGPWLAEFTNPSTESAFRAVELPRTLRELRLSLTVGSILILMFGITDYTTVGLSGAFYWLVGMRFVVGLGTLAFARSLSRYPQLTLTSMTWNQRSVAPTGHSTGARPPGETPSR